MNHVTHTNETELWAKLNRLAAANRDLKVPGAVVIDLGYWLMDDDIITSYVTLPDFDPYVQEAICRCPESCFVICIPSGIAVELAFVPYAWSGTQVEWDREAVRLRKSKRLAKENQRNINLGVSKAVAMVGSTGRPCSLKLFGHVLRRQPRQEFWQLDADKG